MTLSEAAALIGAVTGPLGLLIALFSYFRDRSRLWVVVKTNWLVKNSPQHKPTEHHVIVTVSNIGRRPEYIEMVVGIFPSGDSGTFSDTFFNPNDTQEGSQPRKYLAIQSSLPNLVNQWPGFFVLVRTSSGRQYRSRFLSVGPKNGKHFSWLGKVKMRVQSMIKNRWAFRRRFLE